MGKPIILALIATGFIANVYAFDLGKALEGAVK
jgi:hypothetical protein